MIEPYPGYHAARVAYVVCYSLGAAAMIAMPIVLVYFIGRGLLRLGACLNRS